MQPEDDLKQQWIKLECSLEKRLGMKPDLDAILLFIGIRESGLPPKVFSETEKINLRQMAVCTILVPARYYELFWVDDFGWPHFKQLQREPEMTMPERELFLKPYLLLYAEKHQLM
ncbi:MAG TPA: hypothetical protein VLR49_09885 [Ferruginibacter sp.]|nr:hypothetical protein [Ferruginibacter sp.]